MAQRRTQAERRADAQARLIEAAIRLLASRGYAKTSLSEICREAGFSRALVNHHFGSKEACMEAVVASLRSSAQQILHLDDLRGLDAIDALFDFLGSLRHGDDVEARALYVILIEGITSTPGLRRAVAETDLDVRAQLTAALTQALEDSGRTPLIDIPGLAVLTEAIFRGVTLLWFTDPSSVQIDLVTSVAKATVRAALDAHSRPATPIAVQ